MWALDTNEKEEETLPASGENLGDQSSRHLGYE